MTLIGWIIAFSLVGGVLSVLAAASFLLIPESWRSRLLPAMVSFAIGALLGAAFLAVLPHALESPGLRDMHAITGTVLGGLLGFFLLEKLVLWRHCHADECETHAPDRRHSHTSAAGYLIVIGDGVHNFVDGVLIAAAFYTDIHLGVVTALAVAAHEIPQEVGDFAILLHSGFTRGKAFFYNMLSSLTTVIGGVLAYFFLGLAQSAVPYVLAVAASSFIYIAVADLIPGLHKRVDPRATFEQVMLIACGITVIALAHAALH
ncbi:MAG TPA: ZIP zinc transporter [Gammaproteobacteria bacterium]|nr:ZIP zinc transporter [Gammaproteobacteria bacterium]